MAGINEIGKQFENVYRSNYKKYKVLHSGKYMYVQ